VLAELAAVYRDAGIRVGGAQDAPDAGGALLVDDAHLLDPATLGRVRRAVESGQGRMIIAARPWPAPDGLRELVGMLDGTAVLRRTATRQRLADAQLARGPAWAERVSLTGDLDTALRVADQVLAAPDAPNHVAAARLAAAALAHRGQLGSSAELFRWSGTG